MKTKVIIEFSESWLKALILESQGMHNLIKDMILEPLEPNLVNISGALNRVVERLGKKKGLDVDVVLNRNKITLRKIELPSQEPLEIEQMLGLHVIRLVPYSKEEIIWAYQNLGFDGINISHILVAAAHRDLLKKIFNAFLPLNILPNKMLLSSQGAAHFIQYRLKDKLPAQGAFLVLDIDYNYSDLMLINNRCQLNSSVVIAQGREQLKAEGHNPKFLNELKQSLPALSNDSSQVKIEEIILIGIEGSINGLETDLADELNLKVQAVKSKELEAFKLVSSGVSFSAIIGFSYQQKKEDICFTLPEVQIKKEIKNKIQQLVILGGCASYCFVIAGLIFFSRLSYLQSYRDKLLEAGERLKEKSGGLVEIAQKITNAKQYTDKQQSVLNYFYEFSRICPSSIALTNFFWERQKGLVIRGYAEQMPDIQELINALGNYQLFKGMQAYSTRRHKVKDKEIVEFEIGKK